MAVNHVQALDSYPMDGWRSSRTHPLAKRETLTGPQVRILHHPLHGAPGNPQHPKRHDPPITCRICGNNRKLHRCRSSWGARMGKKRKVFFYSGVEYDRDNQPHPWSENRWRAFLQTAGEPQTYDINGRRLKGYRFDCDRPIVSCLRLAKERPLSDWPEAGISDGSVENLALRRAEIGIESLYEYAFILPVLGTSYVAVFRSSGGPTPSAIADWVSTHDDMPTRGSNFSLNPVLRKNAEQKLQSSLGVKKFTVRFEGVPEGNGSVVDQAASIAGSVVGQEDYANATIELVVSLGRSRVLGPSTDGMQRAVHDITNNILTGQYGHGPVGSIKKLVATTIQPRDDGGTSSEEVDFIAQRITIQEDFGNGDDSALEPQVILDAMLKAVQEFRRMTGEYS